MDIRSLYLHFLGFSSFLGIDFILNLDSGMGIASHINTKMSERQGTFFSPFTWELGKLSYKSSQQTFPFCTALGPCPLLNQPLEGEAVSMICFEQPVDHN